MLEGSVGFRFHENLHPCSNNCHHLRGSLPNQPRFPRSPINALQLIGLASPAPLAVYPSGSQHRTGISMSVTRQGIATRALFSYGRSFIMERELAAFRIWSLPTCSVRDPVHGFNDLGFPVNLHVLDRCGLR